MKMQTQHEAMNLAVSTYRRANGSQAQTVRPRVRRAPKVFPRVSTPSQGARKLANLRRRGIACRVTGCVQFALRIGGPCSAHKHAA